MRRKRRTEITVETEQVVVIRRAAEPISLWCAGCAAAVTMVTPAEAAIITGSSLRAVCREVEADRLHFTETADGLLLICLNSLLTEH
ncbi:MAG TPA: hypothetical protein VFD58_05665 [Blastocatellia bacterium]|nr:hypothetical protein [Blastocatellia bacterium]